MRTGWRSFLLKLGFLALILGGLAVYLLWRRGSSRAQEASVPAEAAAEAGVDKPSAAVTRVHVPRPTAAPAPSAESVVADKLARFSQSRRELAFELARRHNVQVTPQVQAFFAAVESGNWDAIESAYKTINGDDSSAGQAGTRSPEVSSMWPAIADAYGAAEQVHLWPAQQLLDYGNSILGALKPNMVYVGGTDNGRWIPELLNDTSDGERHIVITQNALADASYVDYLRLQYADRFANLTEEDSQRAFNDYLADAQKRLLHDRQFPDELRQVRPGEDIQVSENRVQVGGQVAVMQINERLLQRMMQNNPDLQFAVQESYPLRGTYADALPLGPLMQLRATDDQNSFTPELAGQSLQYWRATAQQVLESPDAFASDTVLRSYSHDTVAAGNLLAAHDFGAEAEQAYRLAMQLWPANPESAGALADFLAGHGRESEARQVLADFAQRYPDQSQDLERTSSMRLLWGQPPGGH